ncbi:MAG: PfkB family carbohydrate kinase [Haloferacaceae archaeon]
MTDIVTVGEALLRLSPPQGDRLVTAGEFDAYVGGAEANAAVAAAGVGIETAWLSRLPDSPLGRRVVRELHAHGVRTGVSWDADGRLGTYYLERGADPRGSEVYYDRAGSTAAEMTPEDVPEAVVRNADTCFITGITPALSETARETTEAVLSAAAAAETTTAFDPNYRSKLWSEEAAREAYEALLPLVDVLIVARRDAADVLDAPDQPVQMANTLAVDYDCETVVLTLGDRGALVLHDGEVHEADAFETDTVDPIGSGDALAGAFLAARSRGDPVDEALSLGVAAAAIKRTVTGDLLVTDRAEVEALADEGSGESRTTR